MDAGWCSSQPSQILWVWPFKTLGLSSDCYINCRIVWVVCWSPDSWYHGVKGTARFVIFSVDRSVGFPIIFRIHRWHRKKWHRAMSCFETGANISISSLASDHNSFKFGWKKMQIQQEINSTTAWTHWKNYSLYIIISKYNNLRLLWGKKSTKSCTILAPHLTQWCQSSTTRKHQITIVWSEPC